MKSGSAERALPNWLQLMAVIAASVACIATSVNPKVKYAGWQVVGDRESTVAGDARVRAWVSKTGKAGFGLTLKIISPRVGDQIVVADAVFHLADAGIAIEAMGLPTTVKLDQQGVGHIYLPFLFDNNRAWNDRQRQGRLSFRLVFAGHPSETWTLNLEQVMRDFCLSSGYSPKIGEEEFGCFSPYDRTAIVNEADGGGSN